MRIKVVDIDFGEFHIFPYPRTLTTLTAPFIALTFIMMTVEGVK